MKIAFVANTCWNIYNFRKGLVRHFISKGEEVCVVAPQDEYTQKIIDWGVEWLPVYLDSTGSNPLKDMSYCRRLYAVFQKEQPDVVLSYTIKSNIYSCLAGKLAAVPIICNVSGLGTTFLVRGLTGKVAMALYKIAFRYSKHTFFQNADDLQLFTSHIPVNKAKTGVVPGSGIDLEAYKPTPLQRKDNIKLLMVSRLIVEKGVREYAEAASAFENDVRVSFTLVGKFDESHTRSISKSELDHWMKKKWLAYHPHSDKIKEMIASHDALVLPSYREGTPRTLLEGAAMCRPLIASDVPGCKEVIREGVNGFLFEVRKASDLINKIKLFLSLTVQEREKMGANSRVLAEEKFDEKIVIDEYEKIIHRIIQVP